MKYFLSFEMEEEWRIATIQIKEEALFICPIYYIDVNL